MVATVSSTTKEEGSVAQQTLWEGDREEGWISSPGLKQIICSSYWCYTDAASCPIAVPDPFLPFLARTTQACSQGRAPVPDPATVAAPLLPILLVGPCECNPYGFHQSGSLGICQGDVFDSSTFCYVTLDSRYASLPMYWQERGCHCLTHI